MRKKRRWLISIGIFLGVLGILGVVAYLKAEAWAKAYIEEKYPGVTIGRLDIHWMERRGTFYNIKVERENLRATLDRVEVDADKNVAVFGGEIDLTLTDDKDDGGGTSSIASLVAEQLIVTVRKNKLKATLLDVSVNATDACFTSGMVEHEKFGTAFFSDGCAKRDKSLVKVSDISMNITLPFDIPKVRMEQTLVVTDLEVEPTSKRLKIGRLAIAPVLLTKPVKTHKDVPPILTLENPSLNLTDDDLLVETQKIEVNHPWVAPYPVKFEKVRATIPSGFVTGEPLKAMRDKIELEIGRAKVVVDPLKRSVSGKEPCAEWLDVMPRPLPEAMVGMDEHFTGTLEFEIVASSKPKFELKQDCKFSCKAKPIADIRNKSKFTYEAYDSKDQLVTREVGPTVAGWTRLGDLPMYVPEAFVLMEDPGFPRHKGVLPLALENSLKVNLEKGGFFKGGSTITMQLAKNLWLQRHKTLGRKAQEALLTFALESCLSKEQILETYVNIIEFGPDIYGIGPAAKHYFKKPVAKLAPDEAFFLASILPAPRKALPPDAGGLDRARKIMKQLAKSGFISEALVDDQAPIDTSSWDLDEN